MKFSRNIGNFEKKKWIRYNFVVLFFYLLIIFQHDFIATCLEQTFCKHKVLLFTILFYFQNSLFRYYRWRQIINGLSGASNKKNLGRFNYLLL